MKPSTTLRILFMLAIVGCVRSSAFAQGNSLRESLSEVPSNAKPADQNPVQVHFADEFTEEEGFEVEPTHHAVYANCVSHDPGRPHKLLRDRPGDINRKDSPPRRYCLPDCERAGGPHEIAWWAKCAVNKHYSAWFVGGGTSWILPKQTRPRQRDEGTWGLDHDGLFHPRRVWLKWGCDRQQGGLGAYETEHERGIVSKWIDSAHE